MRLTSFLALLASALVALGAEFKLSAVISDHMVLQREKPVAIWGWADAGEAVTVRFAGQTKSTTAGADGKWSLKLDALTASAEPRTLEVTGIAGHKLEVKDILVGEVWLGSGQSNMAMTVQSSNNFEGEKATAKYPLIRHYREASSHAEQPQAEGKGAWQECTPDNVGSFSAVLYFFGREIHREVGVPVGLINTSVGGTPIEAWLSAETQQADADTKVPYDAQLNNFNTFDPVKAASLYEKQLATWKVAVEKAKAEKKDLPRKPFEPIAMRKLKGGPAGLYNGKVVNLAPYTLRGMLWYQGEGNAGNGPLYRKQLGALVTSWRTLWNDEVPFAWVQLPNYTSPGEGWPLIRESMLNTLALPKTGMAITIDIGDQKDIHPKNKQDVGKRLSLWALSQVYGRKIDPFTGPLPKGHKIEGQTITLAFYQTGGKLKTKDGGPVKGFQIAGEDKQWKDAEAKIVGDRIVVSSPEVPQPVAARYAWKDWPDCNLYNSADLPASPFRTVDGTSAAKK